MAWRWHGVGITDLLYLGVVAAVLARIRPAQAEAVAMVLFALLVVAVSWTETRRLVEKLSASRRSAVLALGLTVPMLAAWFVLAALPPARLSTYFSLLAGFFFVQAVRDAALLELTPVELVLQGYVNLVAVFIVLGAAADAIDRLQVVLVLIGFLTFFVRKSFQWTGAVLQWLRGDEGS